MNNGCSACVIAAGCLLFGWAGCSVEKNYDLLSFFFDGVPEPGSLEAGGGLLGGRGGTMYSHEPYATESCLECHPNPSQMQLSREDSGVCMKCHEQIPEQYEFMHGAVVGNACLWCHDPHISANPYLLRDSAPALCAQCHKGNQFAAPESAHASEDTDCLSCHNGHGGSEAFFLRDSVDGIDQGSNTDSGAEQLIGDTEPGTPNTDGL